MQQAVEAYVKKKREEFLIQEGLVTNPTDPNMKKMAIEVSDEEYAAIKDAYFMAKPKEKPKDDGNETISTVLKIISVLIYIVGLFLGFGLGKFGSWDSDVGLAFACWGSTILAGTYIFGFAKIIELLHDIKYK